MISMYYDKSELLSYNRIFNFVIGNRGGGKTFNMKEWAINDFLKRGNQFVWVRRYKDELKEVKKDNGNKFIADIAFKFPETEFKVKGHTMFINGIVAGYFIPLSIQQQFKSSSFDKVNKIIYDEFILEKGMTHYLPNEPELFLNLFETVGRMRDNIRAVFIANAVTVVNPYFTYFEMSPKPQGFTVNESIAVEFYKNQEFINAKKQTRFGKLIDGTKYGRYNIENEYLLDNEIFVEPRSKESEFSIALKYDGTYYGFWVDYQQGLIYVSRKYDPSSIHKYVLSKQDHEPNHFLIKNLKNHRFMQRIIDAFQMGYIRFDDMEVKNRFFEYIHHFISR